MCRLDAEEALIKTALNVDDDGRWVFINNDPAVYEILKKRSNPYKVITLMGARPEVAAVKP